MISIPTLRSVVTRYYESLGGYPSLCSSLNSNPDNSTYTLEAVLINGAQKINFYYTSVSITFNYVDFIEPFVQAGATVNYEISGGGGGQDCSPVNYSGQVTSSMEAITIGLQEGCSLDCIIRLTVTGIPSDFFNNNCCIPPPNQCSLNGNTSYTGEFIYFTLEGE